MRLISPFVKSTYLTVFTASGQPLQERLKSPV
jgi:hypothetical protein